MKRNDDVRTPRKPSLKRVSLPIQYTFY
uniref:Uncharacterized protein n=1 Tax=Anguilla anguilla TaxID=7936 RepID=A0A0E9P819_ANGAN